MEFWKSWKGGVIGIITAFVCIMLFLLFTHSITISNQNMEGILMNLGIYSGIGFFLGSFIENIILKKKILKKGYPRIGIITGLWLGSVTFVICLFIAYCNVAGSSTEDLYAMFYLFCFSIFSVILGGLIDYLYYKIKNMNKADNLLK